MALTEDEFQKLRDELTKSNPLINLTQIKYLLLPTAYMTHLDDYASWDNNIIDQVRECLHKVGCSSIAGPGLTRTESFQEEKLSMPYGCRWNAFSPQFLLPLNELSHEYRKNMSIYDLAKKFDVANKTELILDTSNRGDYFWIPDKSGEKTIDEACSVVTPLKKECLPQCSLKKICGKDYRITLPTPKQLSERVLIPLINESWGPLPKERWDEMKDITKEFGSSELKSRTNGKNRETERYRV